MVDRAFVNESAQWALETTPGTAVAANRRVRSMSINIGVEGENEAFRPDGQKFASLIAPNMEWTSWGLNGKPTYTEIVYPLESICGTVSPVTVGTLGRRRTYSIATHGTDSAKTLTIEKGSAVRAAKIAYALLTDLGLTFSRRNGVGITGTGIGQLLTDAITKTGSPTSHPLIPILGKQLDFFIDPASGDLGETKMLRAFSIEPSIGGKYGPVWPIDSDEESFAGHVELAPQATCRIRLEADAAGMAYLSQFRSGDLLFARIAATGPEYESGGNYQFQYDMALGITRISDYGADEDGVTVLTYETEFTDDTTWGKAMEIAVENAVATL